MVIILMLRKIIDPAWFFALESAESLPRTKPTCMMGGKCRKKLFKMLIKIT